MATQTAADLWAKVRGSFVQEQEEEEQAGLLASLNEATTLNRTQVVDGTLDTPLLRCTAHTFPDTSFVPKHMMQSQSHPWMQTKPPTSPPNNPTAPVWLFDMFWHVCVVFPTLPVDVFPNISSNQIRCDVYVFQYSSTGQVRWCMRVCKSAQVEPGLVLRVCGVQHMHAYMSQHTLGHKMGIFLTTAHQLSLHTHTHTPMPHFITAPCF